MQEQELPPQSEVNQPTPDTAISMRRGPGRKDKPVLVEDPEKLSIGAKLRLARQGKGISLTEIARTLKYSAGHISGVENGLGRPSRELVQSYEQMLGMEEGELSQTMGELGKTHKHGKRTPIPEELLDASNLRIGKEVDRLIAEFNLPRRELQMARRMILSSSRSILEVLEEDVYSRKSEQKAAVDIPTETIPEQKTQTGNEQITSSSSIPEHVSDVKTDS